MLPRKLFASVIRDAQHMHHIPYRRRMMTIHSRNVIYFNKKPIQTMRVYIRFIVRIKVTHNSLFAQRNKAKLSINSILSSLYKGLHPSYDRVSSSFYIL